ncbi:hypothetical protein GCM10027589_09660 [Actinocorallia lasiicapitis]
MRGRTVGAAVVVLAVLASGAAAEAKPKAKPKWRDLGTARPLKTGALNQIEFAGPKLGWAAGTEGGKYALALWRFERGKWTKVANPWTFAPAGLAVAGSKKAWLTGVNLTGSFALYYNGKKWKQVGFPGPGIPVDLAAAPDGTAVSAAADPFKGGFTVQSWRFGRWQKAKVPLPAGASVTSVAVGSRKDIWIGGSHPVGDGLFGSLLLHWNGRAWRQIPLAGTSDTARGITKIVVDAPGKVWALRGATETSLVRYNGRSAAEAQLPGKVGALTLTPDGAGGVWVLPYSTSDTSATPYLRWSKGRWLPMAWGPRRVGVPGLGDVEQIPGTRTIVSAGAIQQDKPTRRKIPFTEVFR